MLNLDISFFSHVLYYLFETQIFIEAKIFKNNIYVNILHNMQWCIYVGFPGSTPPPRALKTTF